VTDWLTYLLTIRSTHCCVAAGRQSPRSWPRSTTTQPVYLLPRPTIQHVRLVWPWQGHRGHQHDLDDLEVTGVISTREVLDRERQSVYNLVVIARSNNRPALSSTAHVQIEVWTDRLSDRLSVCLCVCITVSLSVRLLVCLIVCLL